MTGGVQRRICSRPESACLALLVSCVLATCASGGGIGGGGNIVCTSAAEGGECSRSQPPRQGCAATSKDDCTATTYAGDPASLYNPKYTEYPRVKECVSSPSTSSSPTSCVARGLTVILYPVGRDKKYSLYVSWQTTPDDGNLEGFYIWNYKCTGPCPFLNDTTSLSSTTLPFRDRNTYECLPVNSSNARSVLFDGALHRTGLLQCKDGKLYTAPRCNSSAIMTVMVVPRPRSHSLTLSSLLATSSLTLAWENLDDCWPTAFSANCSSPVFFEPVQDFNVTTTALPGERHMSLHVEWLCSPDDVEYIVTVTDPLVSTTPNCTSPGLNPPCFVARDTTRVIIEMLNVNTEYSVSVQVIPRCNGSSLAEHYVGCRSEECCQAKRVSHTTGTSGNYSEATSMAAGGGSTRFSMESSCVRLQSSRVKVESSTDNALTRYVQPTALTSTPVATIFATVPPNNDQGKAGRGGMNSAAIGGAVTVAVAIITTFVSVIVCYLARRRLREHTATNSLTSSLTDSLEDSMDGEGEGNGGAGSYCHMITIDHVGEPPSYVVTTSGTSVSGGCNDIAARSTADLINNETPSLSDGRESQATYEAESLTGGSGESTCSDSFKISSGGGSTSFEDDAFERALLLESDKDGACDDDATCGGSQTMEKIIGRRDRSESVCVKASKLDSNLCSRKRPRSLSTPHVTHPSSLLPPPRPPSALILYSKSSPQLEKRVIQQGLVSDLTQYNIRTVSEDTCTPRECPAAWLETRMREASAVFCVCNEAFDRDWENRSDGLIFGLVPVFKQLCHGLVTPSCGKNRLLRDKIAIVLPRESDLKYVPTYLNSRPKFRLLEQDLENMARFVTGMPQYKCGN